MFNPLDFIFKKRINSVLGIDIGTASIKIAELRREEQGRFRLLNYAILDMQTHGAAEGFRGLSFDLADEDLAKKIQLLIKEAGFNTQAVVMSLPVFSTFVTIMEMPLLEEKELAGAVPLQAREYIPIPIAEVVLDWKVVQRTKKSDLTRANIAPQSASGEMTDVKDAEPIQVSNEAKILSTDGTVEKVAGGKNASRSEVSRKGPRTEVLLMAAPREMVQKYVRIAELAGLTILGLEIESFAYARVSTSETMNETLLLLDIGAFSSSIAIYDEGFLRVVHTVGISSVDLTRAASRALGTDLERAENYKRSYGLYASSGDTEIVTAYLPLLEELARNIERVVSAYWRQSSRQVSKIILSGNAALLAGIDQYIASRTHLKVQVVNPFLRVDLAKDLLPAAPLLSQSLANAIGLAMKEI